MMDGDGSSSAFTRRALLLGAGQLGVLGALGWRLHDLQVSDKARLAGQAVENRIDTSVIAPPRGRILDRTGKVLAENEPMLRVVVVPQLAGDLKHTLDVLSRIITIGPLTRQRVLTRAARQPRGTPIVVGSELTFDQVASIELLAPELPGVRTESAQRRVYRLGPAMGHIVGYVGAHERAAIDDDPVLRLPDMRVGKTGVERAMEDRLRGIAGSIRVEMDAKGRVRRELDRVAPVPGSDVMLTVDADLQRRVMERLRQERRGAVVAIDIATGEIVTLASVPDFDPAEIVGGLSNQSWRRLLSSSTRPMFNRAIGGLYPPGSTFKVITALAALQAGIVSPNERIECNGSFTLGGQTFRCWNRDGHGRNNLHRALAESCDVYFYELARRTGIEAIAAMARRLGLGETTPIEIASQKAGLIPTPDWKRGHFGTPWLAGETILAGIGQGYVLTTPLQLALMTARVASGREVVPTMVRRQEGMAQPTFAPLPIAPQWLDAVRKAMTGVVNEEGGTGQNARIEARGIRVAGKTGTSQVHRASTDKRVDDLAWEQRDHALFVGFVPDDRPRFAVAAVIEHGGGGGAAAAPLVKDVIQMIIDWPGFAAPRPEVAGGAAPELPRPGRPRG